MSAAIAPNDNRAQYVANGEASRPTLERDDLLDPELDTLDAFSPTATKALMRFEKMSLYKPVFI